MPKDWSKTTDDEFNSELRRQMTPAPKPLEKIDKFTRLSIAHLDQTEYDALLAMRRGTMPPFATFDEGTLDRAFERQEEKKQLAPEVKA